MDGLAYADSAGHQLAYRVRPGADGPDVVLFTPGGTIPMDFLERDRIGARLVDGLASIGRVIRFDRRGIGLSDPIVDWSTALVEQWGDDLATIVDEVCADAPVVVSLGDYWGPARLFAARHPTALSALVLYEPTGPAQPIELTPSVGDGRRGLDRPRVPESSRRHRVPRVVRRRRPHGSEPVGGGAAVPASP